MWDVNETATAQQSWENSDEFVYNSLLGFATLHSGLIILDGCNAIIWRDYANASDKVRLISGASGGNEPSHIGFVGSGMLTAALAGNLSSAPSSHAIFNVIEEIGTDHSPGILLIVENRAGYNVNFALAKLRARRKGINVKMIIVGDDNTENSWHSMAKRQGLSGVIFLHKIAGAMAEEGQSLDEIYTACEQIVKSGQVTTVSIDIKQIFAENTRDSQRGSMYEIEIGYGSSGEVENEKIQYTSWKDIAAAAIQFMVNTSLDGTYSRTSGSNNFRTGNNVAVLINNLGGHNQMESNIFALEIVSQLKMLGLNVQRIYMGSLMTLPGVNGFLISLLHLSSIPRLVEYLDAPTTAPAWPRMLLPIDDTEGKKTSLARSEACTERKLRSSASDGSLPFIESHGPKMNERDGQILLTTVTFACEALIACMEQLDTMDTESGDGDCGTTLARGANAVISAIKENKISTERPFVSLTQIGYIIERFMGGLQGGLYAIFFEAAANVFNADGSTEEISARMWLDALHAGTEAISHFGKVSAGKRTMLDSLIAAQEELTRALNFDENILSAFGKAVKAAEEKATETLYARSLFDSINVDIHKRFQYPDAGAHAVGIWMRAAYEAIKLKRGC